MRKIVMFLFFSFCKCAVVVVLQERFAAEPFIAAALHWYTVVVRRAATATATATATADDADAAAATAAAAAAAVVLHSRIET